MKARIVTDTVAIEQAIAARTTPLHLLRQAIVSVADRGMATPEAVADLHRGLESLV